MTEPICEAELEPEGKTRLELFLEWYNDPLEITEAEASTFSEELAVFLREEKKRELGEPMQLWSPPNEAPTR